MALTGKQAPLSERQRQALAAFADAVAPTPEDGAAGRPVGCSASALGVPVEAERRLLEAGDPVLGEARAGLDRLLDEHPPLEPGEWRVPEASIRALRPGNPLLGLRDLVLLLTYALVPQGAEANPNWAATGYPGPPARRPPATPNGRRPLVTAPGTSPLATEVCVIGSGAGGSVIAAELARAGHEVVVLERGGSFEREQLNGLELWAQDHLYRPPQSTRSGSVGLIAGSAVGGGTLVNWSTSLPTPAPVREQWEEHGLVGVGGAEFDSHLEAVSRRIEVTEELSDLNGPHRLLAAGAERLGYRTLRLPRNANAALYDPATAGFLGFGDVSGSKRSTADTYLRDAVDAGARLFARCRAERIRTRAGRATTVEALLAVDGEERQLTIEAETVVVACGALDTPGLLLRSGLGNDQVGRHLHLHPAAAVLAHYDERTDPWWGPPQSLAVSEFADLEDGCGFLIEGVQVSPGLLATVTPWRSGADHRRLMGELGHAALFSAIIRDRGSGTVAVDERGAPEVGYELGDERDRRLLRRGMRELARLHRAAGAARLTTLHREPLVYERDRDDFEDYLDSLERCGLGLGDPPLFSAHHMGSCRMGRDERTSAADEWGRLRGVDGIWVGDASAFPTALGANPMLTTMALARRTAAAMKGEIAK